jgi:hypothetical protein
MESKLCEQAEYGRPQHFGHQCGDPIRGSRWHRGMLGARYGGACGVLRLGLRACHGSQWVELRPLRGLAPLAGLRPAPAARGRTRRIRPPAPPHTPAMECSCAVGTWCLAWFARARFLRVLPRHGGRGSDSPASVFLTQPCRTSSLVPKRHRRVHRRRSASWDDTGQDRRGEQHRRAHRQNPRVARRNAIEERRHQLAKRE